MEIINVNQTLRPIKLAFVVDYDDKKTILEVIRINSLLWGGVYNPIIPYFARKPKELAKDILFKRENNEEIVKGYLEAYDPDYVINLSKFSANIKDRETITLSDIINDLKEEGVVGYGISLFEIFNHFYREELRFIRKHPIDIIQPKWSSRYELFFASIFGKLPDQKQT